MSIDRDRIVHCTRHLYRDPLHQSHKFWLVGVAPPDEEATGALLPRDQQSRPGETLRQRLSAAKEAFAEEYLAGKRDDATGALEWMELGEECKRAWSTSPKFGTPSPRQQAIERFYARLDWWVCADNGGQPGEVVISKAYRFPASCLAEGLLQERVYPDGRPNMLAGMGKDSQLVPYKGTCPQMVAYWAACFHFGYPRINRVRMQVVKNGKKVEIPNSEPVDGRPDLDVDAMRERGLIREVSSGK